MANEVESYGAELRQQILAERDQTDETSVEAFTRIAAELVAAEVDDQGDAEFTAAFHRSRGMAVEAFAFSGNERALHLVVTNYKENSTSSNITKTEITSEIGRLNAFLRASLFEDYAGKLDRTSPAWELADRIRVLGKQLKKITLVLATNLIARKPEPPELDVLPGIELVVEIWDLQRIARTAMSGRRLEPVRVDLVGFNGGPVCIPAPKTGDVSVFLSVLPGMLLASIYDEYGARLLERNVRSFLQNKGVVNRGIRDTLRKDPQRFLSYNNGISATAARVVTKLGHDGLLRIVALDDVQIVNGGQTTASIHSAWKNDKADLGEVYVQAKITEVPAEHIDEVVARISQYANTQNKVTGADFAANHSYHSALEAIARTVWAPAVGGTQQQTHWFYERARGQYADETIRAGTPAARAKFKKLNPPAQRFTKTEHAKYENAWAGLPHIANLGAEKNFQKFMDSVDDTLEIDDEYFRECIGRAIAFRAAEKLFGVARLSGYRVNAVNYAVALLADRTDGRIDFQKIWRAQDISKSMGDAFMTLLPACHAIIVDPPVTTRHAGEWTKKLECWKRVKDLPWLPSSSLKEELLAEAPRKRRRSLESVSLGGAGRALASAEQLWAGASAEHKGSVATELGVPVDASWGVVRLGAIKELGFDQAVLWPKRDGDTLTLGDALRR